MSKKCDALKQIRLLPYNHRALVKIQKKFPLKFPIGTIANMAIEKGLVVMESERVK